MSDEKFHRYWHAEHCGVYCDIKTSGTEEVQERNKNKTLTEVPCALCGEQTPAQEITRFEHERYTAVNDDCINCGEKILFLPDRLEWRHHEDESVSLLEPEYGVRSCEEAMTRLLGLPAPHYTGVASPANATEIVQGKTEDGIKVEAEVEKAPKKRKTKDDVARALADFLKTVD